MVSLKEPTNGQQTNANKLQCDVYYTKYDTRLNINYMSHTQPTSINNSHGSTSIKVNYSMFTKHRKKSSSLRRRKKKNSNGIPIIIHPLDWPYYCSTITIHLRAPLLPASRSIRNKYLALTCLKKQRTYL